VVDSPPGTGPAAARNAGAAQATGTVLVFVDSDVLVHADAFRRIRESFASDRGRVAVFGSYDDAPSEDGAVSVFRNLLHHWIHQSSAGRATTFWAGLGAVRRDAFLAVGGFDSRRFPVPSVEDIEIGLRLARTGQIELDPRIQGKHLKRWSLGGMVVTDLVHRGAPWVALMLARGRSSIRLNVSGRHLTGTAACLAALALAALGRPVPALAMAVVFVAVNARLYSLLLRHGGVLTAAAGFCLHVLHSVVALVAVPAGLLLFARELFRPSRRPAALRAQPDPEGEAPPA
jgi:GT2 family glycosyltransferase